MLSAFYQYVLSVLTIMLLTSTIIPNDSINSDYAIGHSVHLYVCQRDNSYNYDYNLYVMIEEVILSFDM